MNSIVSEYLAASYLPEYQALRDQLMELLTDGDLAFRLGGSTVSLGALCREIGEIEHSYVESFKTFVQDFGYRNRDPRLEVGVAALKAWYAELDGDLMAALEGLTEEDLARRKILRGDFEANYFEPTVADQLDVYREALLIFYGKVSIYLRAIDRPLPPQWHHWIG